MNQYPLAQFRPTPEQLAHQMQQQQNAQPAFDPSKPVQCRDGSPARIICTDWKNDSSHEIIALVGQVPEVVEYFHADGRQFSMDNGPHDLVNIPQLIQRVVWLNFHQSLNDVTLHLSLESSQAHYATARVCVQIDVEVGTGVNSPIPTIVLK